jgi:AcrR family transcriptional regulator
MVTTSGGWSRARRPSTREQTRDAIVETALRLFSERGYVGVRVEDIARESGVSRATFYKHFAERDEILAELFGRLLGTPADIEATGGDVRARVVSLLTQVAQRMLGDEMLARFVYSLPVRHDAVLPGGPTAPPAMERIKVELAAGASDGSLRPDIPVDVVVEIVGRAFEAAMRDWAEGRVDDPHTRLEQLLSVVFDGVTPRP